MTNAQRNCRQWQQRQQSQLPVDPQHQHYGKDRHDNGVRRVHNAGPKQHPDVAQVIRYARHQIARLVLLKKGQREAYQMAEQVIPYGIFDVAGYPDDQPPHEKPENTFADG